MRNLCCALFPAVLVGWSSSLAAQAPGLVPELEPNDSAPVANSIAPGLQVQAALTPGDVDFYRFTLVAPARVHLFTGRVGGVGIDTVLQLWDVTGATQLAYDDDSRGAQSSLAMDLGPGTWLASVSGFSGTVNGAYSLDLGLDAVQVATLVENSASEQANNRNNNNGGSPTAIPGGPCLVTVQAARPNAADEDWYSLSLPTQSGVWILVNEGKGSWISQYRWDLLDASGGALPAAFGATGGNSPIYSVRSSLQRVWPAGNYRIKISERTGCTSGGASVPCATVSPYSKVPYGSYSMSVVTVPMLTGATRPHSGSATLLAGGEVGSGMLSAASPGQDWVVNTSGPSTLFLQTRGGSGTALQDTTLQIFDSSGLLVATSSGGNVLANTNGLHARMVVSLNQSGAAAYTVRVTGGGSQPGYPATYLLEVGLATCTPYLTAGMLKKEGNVFCTTGGLRVEFGAQLGELPVVGTLFVTEVANAPPSSLLLRLIGTSDTFSSTFGPLPVDMGPLGAPNCSLMVDPMVIEAWLAGPAGTAQFAQSLPTASVFLGFALHEQVAAFDPFANPLGLVLSNPIRYVLGNRPF